MNIRFEYIKFSMHLCTSCTKQNMCLLVHYKFLLRKCDGLFWEMLGCATNKPPIFNSSWVVQWQLKHEDTILLAYDGRWIIIFQFTIILLVHTCVYNRILPKDAQSMEVSCHPNDSQQNKCPMYINQVINHSTQQMYGTTSIQGVTTRLNWFV